jgi:hypothetical protein
MQQLRLHYCTAISLNTQLPALLRTDTQNALQNAEYNANTARVRNKTFWVELKLKQHRQNRQQTALMAACDCMGNSTCVIH